MLNKNKQQGFTLLEVMITVAIIAILTSIAYPSYLDNVQKGKRSDAKVALLRIAQLQESFFAQNLSYANDLTVDLKLPATPKSEHEEYSLIIKSTSPGGCAPGATPCVAFVIEASPIGAQVHDTDCPKFTLSSSGKKGTNGSQSPEQIRRCWK